MNNDKPSGDGVDLLAVIDKEIEYAGCKRFKAVEAREKRLGQIRTAVASLLSRNAELEAERAGLIEDSRALREAAGKVAAAPLPPLTDAGASLQFEVLGLRAALARTPAATGDRHE